jgi:hypothetical protein
VRLRNSIGPRISVFQNYKMDLHGIDILFSPLIMGTNYYENEKMLFNDVSFCIRSSEIHSKELENLEGLKILSLKGYGPSVHSISVVNRHHSLNHWITDGPFSSVEGRSQIRLLMWHN